MKKFTFLIVALTLFFLQNRAQSDNDLVSYWTFEEGSGTTVTDVSGNNHNGTLNGSVEFTDDAIVGDYAVEFHRESEYIDVGDIALGNLFTISMWAKIPTGASNIQCLFANCKSGAGEDGFAIFVNQYPTTDKSIQVYTGNGTDYDEGASSMDAFPYDRWNHVAVVMDKSSGKTTVYCNGVNVTADSDIRSDYNTSGTCYIGSYTNAAWAPDGLIDDVQIFNKKLTEAEVKDIYNANAPNVEVSVTSSDALGSENGPVAASFTVTRNNTKGDALVYYSVSGSALPEDYEPVLSGVVTIPDGSSSTDVAITPIDDDYYEGIETLIIKLTENAAYTILADSMVILSIEDNEDFPDDLYAYWPMDDGTGTTITDLSGNNHHGELMGTGGAFDLDAVVGTHSVKFNRASGDEYISAGNLNLGTQFTISMWAKIPTGASNIQCLFANARSGSGGNGLVIQVNEYPATDRSIRVFTGDGTTDDKASSNTEVFEYDRWNHIAVTMDKSAGRAKIYLNGKDVTADDITLSNYPTSGDFFIGSFANAPAWTPNAWVDDVRIYSKKLSPSQIVDIKNASAQSFNLAYTIYGEGTITPDDGKIKEGTDLELEAIPASGWNFLKWGGDLSGTNPANSFTMDTAKNVIALFIKEQPEPLDTIAKINFTRGEDYDVDGWTSVYGIDSYPLNLENGITVSVESNGKSMGNGGSGEPINMFPSTVGSTYNYWHSGDPYVIDLTFSGLNPASKYTFNAFCSRQNTITEDRPTGFSIQDSLQTAELNSRGNAVNLATFAEVTPNTSGEIVLSMSNIEGTYAYINALVITQDKATISSSIAQSDVIYYPVPVSDVLHIDGLSKGATVSVFNIAGQKILHRQSENDFAIDMSHQNPGVYIIRIVDGESSRSKSFKIIKK
jgi:hypothetical protein